MPTFEFTSPEGKKYKVDGPVGATQEQAFAMLQKQLGETAPPSLMNTATKYSAGSGVANFLDMIPNALTNVANLGIAGYGLGKRALTGSADLPELLPADSLSGFSKIGHAVGAINDEYRPTTTGGKLTDFATQAITGGGINPAAVARNAAKGAALPIVRDFAAAGASGLGAGIGSVATENVKTGSDSLDNAIKAAATVFGGLVPGAVVAARGTAGDRAAAATKGITPEQFQAAKDLSVKASNAGTPITAYEALQVITGLNPKMQTQQRVVEQSDAAANRLTPMMQNRPQANAALFDKVTQSISPQQANPDTLAGQLQAASQSAIDNARKSGNILAEPYYAKSSNDPNVRIPANDWYKLASDPGIEAALKAVKSDPFNGLKDAQPGSVQWLDAAKKWLDSQSQVKAQAGDRFAAGSRSGKAQDIVSVVDPTVPDYAKARAIIADNMRNNVTPMEQSQVGKLSRSDDFKAQSEALLPNAPADINPSVIRRTVDTIGAQNPDILKQFLAQDLRRKFNESNQQNMTGENVFGGSKFAAGVAGNAGQEANLMEAIKASGANSAPFKDALDIYRAQGMKPPVNSATASNLAESSALTSKLADFLTRPIQSARGTVDGYRNGLSTKALAEALSDPSMGVQRIEELARINGMHDPVKQQLLINLLLGNKSINQESSATQ